MLAPFDRSALDKWRHVLRDEHHGPLVIGIVAGLPRPAAYALRPEDVSLPTRTLSWSVRRHDGVDVTGAVHIGPRLGRVLIAAMQKAQEDGRLQWGAPIFRQPIRPVPPGDWPPWQVLSLTPARRGRQAAWQLVLTENPKMPTAVLPHTALVLHARAVCGFWAENDRTGALDPEGNLDWSLRPLGDGLELVPPPRPPVVGQR
jgi:hypothetical protein